MHRMKQKTLQIETKGRGTFDISNDIQRIVDKSNIQTGLCHLFLQHTSASLILCENADPTVRVDLENFMARIAPDGDPGYLHDMEGPDDMPAHIKASLMGASVQIPITDGKLNLGIWQGIYLCEHRNNGGSRNIVITAFGN